MAEPESVQIMVCARVRPTFDEERSGEITVSKRYGSQKSMQVRQLEFSLDWCFDEDATQEEIFDIACHDSVASVLDGFNATILAYGQTGSGKVPPLRLEPWSFRQPSIDQRSGPCRDRKPLFCQPVFQLRRRTRQGQGRRLLHCDDG